MKRGRVLAGLATTGVLILTLTACTDGRTGDRGQQEQSSAGRGLIGVAMPTKTSERWIDDGNNFHAKL